MFLLFSCFLYVSVGPRPSVMVLDKNMPCHERSLHFLSVPDLVFYHGDRKHWWGDLSANETRILYHSLLPYYYPTYLKEYHPVDLARMVFEARRSARTYARRRSCFHVRCMSVLLDGIRNIVRHRKWKTKFDDVWNKHGHCWNDEQQIAMRVLNGSCHTNYWADRFCGTRRIEKMML